MSELFDEYIRLSQEASKLIGKDDKKSDELFDKARAIRLKFDA